MQIAKLKISNILGIEDLEFTPGGFNQITGKNGKGKTTILEAIKAVTGGGHDATLLREGAEKGEIVLVLDDDTEITKTVTKSGSTSEVRRDGKKQPRPAETIKALTDSLSVNPVKFLMADKKDRVKTLLEAMPIEADSEFLSEVAGFPVEPKPGLHALHLIDQVHKQIYDARTGTNRAIREKQATINQLEAAVPPMPEGVGDAADEMTLEANLHQAESDRDHTLERIRNKLDGLKAQAQADIDAVREETQRLIDEAKAAGQAKVDAINAALAEQESKAATAREKAHNKFSESATPINTQLAVIRNDREAAGRRKQTIETIEVMKAELEGLQAEADSQSSALDQLTDYKSDLLAKLPIQGLEVKDGEIYCDGIQLDRLNTAKQVEIAVEIAKMRAADLGVICVDRIECLDSETLEAFKESALASGLQLFVTRVSDEDFSIQTEG